MITTWENECGTAPRANAGRPPTRSLDLREEGLAMQATRVCSVTDCDLPYRCSGFCKVHYDRQLRLGTPHLRVIPETCTVEGCDLAHRARGYCATHWKRWRLHGDPMTTLPNPGETPGELNASWVGEDIGYAGLHKRLRRIRGIATDHQCARCDQPAEQWAYDKRDASEKLSAEGFPYSVDLDRYEPLCLSCHWEADHREPKARTA